LDDDEKREYHTLYSETDSRSYGYLGIELAKILLEKSGVTIKNDITIDEIVLENGIYMGEYTLEVDIMKKSFPNTAAMSKIVMAFNDVSLGGDQQANNFEKELGAGNFYKCLNKIETRGVGKGRFAQRFSDDCLLENIPDYIKNAISFVVGLTNKNE